MNNPTLNSIWFEKITACRLCHGSRLHSVFDLGEQILSGKFPAQDEPEPPAAPLAITKCLDCGLVQLAHDFDLDEFYRDSYGYRSGINATMTAHLAGITGDIERLLKLTEGDVVLDIASNDATLLKSYRTKGLRRVGIDPTAAIFRDYYPSDVSVIADYFSKSNFDLANPAGKAKAITSIAVFYDLPDPNRFVSDIAAVLADDGVWILEQSDIGMMLQQNSFDTICHEHLEYYAFKQIDRLVSKAGLRIFDVGWNGSNGGSARCYVCHQAGPFTDNDASLTKARQREVELRLDDLETYRNFQSVSEATKSQCLEFLRRETAAGRKIHIYGASTKGNVLLQYCGIDASLIEAASERNPNKFGHRTPGTNIPIISEEESRAMKPDYLLVLPWHFRDEFIAREADYISAGGRLIFPLPNFEIYPDRQES